MDERSFVIHVAREVYVYKIPPRTSIEGYKAATWGDLAQPLWKGRMRIFERGPKDNLSCDIVLEDGTTGDEFARTTYNPTRENTFGGVEPVLDSARYFVLTLVHPATQAKIFIGLGFEDRSDAFDFNVALQDFVKRKTQVAQPAAALPTPALDLSLKPGETMQVSLGSTKRSELSSGKTGFGGFPPPPK